MEEASELDRLGVIDWTKSWFGRRVLKNLYTRSKLHCIPQQIVNPK